VKAYDVVDDLAGRLMDALPAAAKSHVDQAVRAVRAEWGGRRVFVGKRNGEGKLERNQAILRDYQRGERLPFLERRYGVTQRHILRIIKGDI
jgi:Mor family transcriptional regulator